jgi:hypothetical protein
MKNNSWGIVIFLSAVLLGGCSQPLRTLMSLGAEQASQAAEVKAGSRCFERLLEDVKERKVSLGMTRVAVRTRYGEPVLIEKDTFLYRSPTAFLTGPRVYLDFDKTGGLAAVRVDDEVSE